MARKKSTPDWQALNAKILAGLDLSAEFAALGLDLTGRDAKADGWQECRAVGREDVNPSAAVNVQSGRYRDLGGDGLSLSLYDLAVHLRKFARWQEARAHYAAKAGVTIEADGKAPRDPAEHLAFMPWNDGLAMLWCRSKPGISVESLRANGTRLARYRDQYTTLCIPIWGSQFTSCDPTGYVLFNTTGKDLPVWHGKGNKLTWAKMKTTGGSESGLIGQHALDRLTAADVDPARQLLWKVEGPTDLLALWSIIPPEKRDNHLVITNSGGAQENPQPWMQAIFAGRNVVVVGDADAPGQAGAAKWAAWAAKVAGEVRIVKAEAMGFEVTKTHGKDLRDWMAGKV